MACGCQARNNSSNRKADSEQQQKRQEPAPQTASVRLPYDTMPTEACLLCADKHLSMACAEAASTSVPWVVLGELELARRHLLGVSGELSSAAAETLLKAASAEPGWRAALTGLSDMVCTALEAVSADDVAARGAVEQVTKAQLQDSMNPLLGVVRLGAACRLARELGYMPKNRAVIVGDLVAAAEQLVRRDNTLANMIRELRHSVQVTPRADLSILWHEVCDRAVKLLPDWYSPEYRELLPGLRSYLGLPAE